MVENLTHRIIQVPSFLLKVFGPSWVSATSTVQPWDRKEREERTSRFLLLFKNMPTVQFTRLKCTGQWTWVYYIINFFNSGKIYCYGLNVTFPKFICWGPNPQCGGIWRWGFGEMIGFGWGRVSRAPRWDWCPHKGMNSPELSLSQVRTWQEGGCLPKPGSGSLQNPTMLAPWSWTSSFHDCEKKCLWFKMVFCCNSLTGL